MRVASDSARRSNRRRTASASTGTVAGALLLAGAVLGGQARALHANAAPLGSDVVAIRAGTIHVVEDGRVLEGGATILVRNGKIQAIGAGLEVPAAAQVIDYGPDAVIVPGLVAPYSAYALGYANPRTASPGTRAVDAFDAFGAYAGALAGGVTSTYITPAESRLIGGVGALVKMAGEGDRVVNETGAIHGGGDVVGDETRRWKGWSSVGRQYV